jgi:hypothetical protein
MLADFLDFSFSKTIKIGGSGEFARHSPAHCYGLTPNVFPGN